VAQIDVALNTGMRKSEQFGLTWNRVYLDKRFVFLDTAKNGHSRYVCLNKRAKAAFMFMKERHDQIGGAKNALVYRADRQRGGLTMFLKKRGSTMLSGTRSDTPQPAVWSCGACILLSCRRSWGTGPCA